MLSRYNSLFAGDPSLPALFTGLAGLMNPWSWAQGPSSSMTVAPQVDIVEAKDGLELICDLPGAQPDDVNVEVENGILTIRSKRSIHYGDSNLVRSERFAGEFARSFKLGDSYDLTQISATLHNGVLVVRVAKRPETEPRQIPVLFDSGAVSAKQLGEKPDGDKGSSTS